MDLGWNNISPRLVCPSRTPTWSTSWVESLLEELTGWSWVGVGTSVLLIVRGCCRPRRDLQRLIQTHVTPCSGINGPSPRKRTHHYIYINANNYIFN